jgi:anti-sigma B factor antagonist
MGDSDSVGLTGAWFSRRREHDTVVLEVVGQIDLSNAAQLASHIRAAEETDATKIVLDLSLLEFIDSTGLRELVIAQGRSDRDSDRLRLRNAHGVVARAIYITGLDHVLRTERPSTR